MLRLNRFVLDSASENMSSEYPGCSDTRPAPRLVSGVSENDLTHVLPTLSPTACRSVQASDGSDGRRCQQGEQPPSRLPNGQGGCPQWSGCGRAAGEEGRVTAGIPHTGRLS